ncbi:acetyltransferase [Vibrio cholerae]|nr:acetyltransferase [Vibrio cholerae]
MQLFYLSLVVMRCQPLRRALCAFLLNTSFLIIYP